MVKIYFTVLLIGMMWGCGGDYPTTQQMTKADGQKGRPLSKLAVPQQAVVWATLRRDSTPVSGATLKFARSVAGQVPAYHWSGVTDADGRVSVEVASDNVTGYYQARALQDGQILGQWTSIPINGGYKIELDLPLSGRAAVTGSSPLANTRPIKIGVLYSAEDPKTTRYGAELAAIQFNQAGGIHNRPIQLLMRDDQNNTARSVELAEALIHRDEVLALVGPDWSVHALEVRKIAQSSGIPMVTTYPTNPAIPNVGDFVFMAAFPDEVQGNVMGAFASDVPPKGLGATTAAVLAISGIPWQAYSEGLAGFFAHTFDGAIVARQFYTAGDTDFTAQLQAIAEVEPNVIFLPGFIPEVPRAIKQARDMGIAAVFLGADGWDHAALFDIGGNALDNSYFTAGFIAVDDIATLSPGAREFVTAYTSVYGTVPNWPASLGYDAVRLIGEAIARVDPKNLMPDAVRDQIAATQHYNGVAMIANFDENRYPVRSVGIYKTENGKIELHKLIEP